MRRHYVYYSVPEAALGDAVAAVRQVHAALGVAVELLRRPAVSKGLVTLMEIHALDDAAAHDLEALAAAALAPWLDGARHVEIFDPVD